VGTRVKRETKARKKRPHLPVARVRESGYRMTSGRKAVLDTLSQAKGHLSAEDIYLKVHAVYPAIGLTSVYRTLQILVNLGLVFKFDFGDGRSRYEVVEGPKGIGHHHHFICTRCGRIIDYSEFTDEELALLKKVEEGLAEKYRLRITNHNLQFHGFCDRCTD
jgi:Fur family ferric uptake transcriptional regulator